MKVVIVKLLFEEPCDVSYVEKLITRIFSAVQRCKLVSIETTGDKET